MTQLLHIDASARRKSFSRQVSGLIARAWREQQPGGSYDYLDLAANPVPHVDEAQTEINEYASANGLTGVEGLASAVRTPEQRAAWAVTRPLLEQLLTADMLLIGTPMYNFSIPSVLKAWIDRIAYPWVDLSGKEVVIATARGGNYAPGSPRAMFDYQETYLRAILSQFSLSEKDVTFVNTEMTFATVVPLMAKFKDVHETSFRAALEAATNMGKQLADQPS